MTGWEGGAGTERPMELGVPAKILDLILQCGNSPEEGSGQSKSHSPLVPWSELGVGVGGAV